MSDTKTPTVDAALKVLGVLDILMRHFAHGMAPKEIAKAADLSPSLVTRYVATLEAAGFAERIPETGRIRPSTRFARSAVAILKSLDDASSRLDELKTRVNRTH